MDIIDRILKAIDDRNKKKTTPIDRIGTVKRIDGNTAWVHIDNGVDVTPVAKTINCEKGDTVRVRMSSGNAYILGNDTRPPTDDAEALVAKAVAKLADKTAIKAQDTADVAQATAENAKDTAETAATTANEAKTIADDTEQHFWFTETGADTGAHITEVPQEEWNDVSDPNYHTGGNLLARSNGIAVRDGMTELASFGTSESIIGQSTGTSTHVTSDGLQFYDGSTSQGQLSYQNSTGWVNGRKLLLNARGTGNLTYASITEEIQPGTTSSKIDMEASYPTGIDYSTRGRMSLSSGGLTLGFYYKNTGESETALGNTIVTGYGSIDTSGNITAAGNITASGNITANGKLTAGAINNSLFEVTDVSFSINASSATAYEETSTSGQSGTTKTGYYPLGVVGYYISTSGAYSRGCYMSAASSGSCTIKMRIQATSTGNKSCTAKVLWVKTTA